MADLNQASAPKVQVRGKFGQVDQISLDTNRPSLQGETLWRSQQMVSFSSRGIYSDALVWILTPAVVIRLTYHLTIAMALPGMLGVLLCSFLAVPVLLLILFAFTQSFKTHGGAAIYRYLLLLIGFILAVS